MQEPDMLVCLFPVLLALSRGLRGGRERRSVQEQCVMAMLLLLSTGPAGAGLVAHVSAACLPISIRSCRPPGSERRVHQVCARLLCSCSGSAKAAQGGRSC